LRILYDSYKLFIDKFKQSSTIFESQEEKDYVWIFINNETIFRKSLYIMFNLAIINEKYLTTMNAPGSEGIIVKEVQLFNEKLGINVQNSRIFYLIPGSDLISNSYGKTVSSSAVSTDEVISMRVEKVAEYGITLKITKEFQKNEKIVYNKYDYTTNEWIYSHYNKLRRHNPDSEVNISIQIKMSDYNEIKLRMIQNLPFLFEKVSVLANLNLDGMEFTYRLKRKHLNYDLFELFRFNYVNPLKFKFEGVLISNLNSHTKFDYDIHIKSYLSYFSALKQYDYIKSNHLIYDYYKVLRLMDSLKNFNFRLSNNFNYENLLSKYKILYIALEKLGILISHKKMFFEDIENNFRFNLKKIKTNYLNKKYN